MERKYTVLRDMSRAGTNEPFGGGAASVVDRRLLAPVRRADAGALRAQALGLGRDR